MSVLVDNNPKTAAGSAKYSTVAIPPIVKAELGGAMTEGARKYGRFNWRKDSITASTYIDALSRHIDAWIEGEDIDQESGYSHIVKAIATLVVMRDAMLHGMFNDDRPPKSNEGWQLELNKKAAQLIEKYPNAKQPVTEINSIPDKNDFIDQYDLFAASRK